MFCVLWTLVQLPNARAEITLPQIDPAYTIQVDADTVAREIRGNYEVLAFEGNCRISQGQFEASAREIVLWIERISSKDIDHPGKTICYLNGQVDAKWGQAHRLRDHQWMGRLFSVHPVVYEAQVVRRYDIPTLDWNREPGSVQLAQFMQTQDAGQTLTAPPLLMQSPNHQNAATMPRGNLPPPTPGSVTWDPNTNAAQTPAVTQPPTAYGTRSSDLLPQGGLVIPGDGSTPYPAASSRVTQGQPGGQLPLPQQGPEEIAPAPTMAPGAPQLYVPEQVVRQVPTVPFSAKSVQFLKRSATPPEIKFEYDASRGESIGKIKGGFKLVVQGIQVAGSDGSTTDFGTVSLEADNAVLWVRSDGPVNILDLSSTPDRPIELYLDGNIVFFQGNRVIYADRMYYNVSSEYGMVLSAEILTPVPQYQGLLRLKADVLQQRDANTFKAFQAAVTSSRMGVPRYWMQAAEVDFVDNRDEEQLSVFAPTEPNRPTNMRAQARSNHIYLGGFPIFYWPTFATNLDKPSFYLQSLRFKNDDIFGFQAYARWDLFQLLGYDTPQGTDFSLSTDYLEKRGPAIGTRFDYNRPSFLLGIPGYGFSDFWFLRDKGLDTLGADRQNMTPERTNRGRSVSRHHFFFSPNWEATVETSWISDRNFLEMFFENEWEQQKDYTTSARIRRYNGNRLFDAYAATRVNKFFTETEWYPKLDHYWLGQDLLNEKLTWSAYTSIGYGRQRVVSDPIDPKDAAKFQLLPWETTSKGVIASTRQELSAPMRLGGLKVVPFLSGEVAHFGQDVNQTSLTRFTGQAGVRTSVPFWKVYPNIENRLFDLRGIAHKVTLDTELFYADSSEDLDRLPLYDPLDDNSQEHFRRRFIFNTFGGATPAQFDERGYAFRTGMQRWITAGSREIVDDLTQVRFGVDQRWQTKRGLPGRERIVDLVSLDFDFIYFPKKDRDNFGNGVGVMNYDFRYHVGDRLTLLSDGYMDLFDTGLRSVSAGAQISRPGVGDAYLGYLSLEGPVRANVLNGYLNYRLDEKWILTGGGAVDFTTTGAIGQSLSLTRIGESALVRVGMNIDHGRNNVSFNFNIEPRFLPTVRLGSVGGQLVPPAGLNGLE